MAKTPNRYPDLEIVDGDITVTDGSSTTTVFNDGVRAEGANPANVVTDGTDDTTVYTDSVVVTLGTGETAGMYGGEVDINDGTYASAYTPTGLTTTSAEFTIKGRGIVADGATLDALDGANTTDVTLAGTPDYLTLAGQEITLTQIDLASDVTGLLPASAGALLDSEVTSLSGVKSLTVPDSTTISAFAKTLLDDTTQNEMKATLGLSSVATINSALTDGPLAPFDFGTVDPDDGDAGIENRYYCNTLAGSLWRDNGVDAWVQIAGSGAGITGGQLRLFTYSASTDTNSDPGSGNLRLNHATPASATVLAISHTNLNGNSYANAIALIAPGHQLLINDAQGANLYSVSGTPDPQSTYTRFTITHEGSAPTNSIVAGNPVGIFTMLFATLANVGQGTIGNLNSRFIDGTTFGGSDPGDIPIYGNDGSGNPQYPAVDGSLITLLDVDNLDTTGTPDGTKFLRDDGQWTAIAGGSGNNFALGEWDYQGVSTNPTSGRFATSSTTKASVAYIGFNVTPTLGAAATNILGTIATNDLIYIQNKANPTTDYALYAVTGKLAATRWSTTHLGSAGAAQFAVTDDYALLLVKRAAPPATQQYVASYDQTATSYTTTACYVTCSPSTKYLVSYSGYVSSDDGGCEFGIQFHTLTSGFQDVSAFPESEMLLDVPDGSTPPVIKVPFCVTHALTTDATGGVIVAKTKVDANTANVGKSRITIVEVA